MKTKKEFFKENYAVSIIVNLLYTVPVFILSERVFEELFLQIFSTFTILFIVTMNTLTNWYRDERIDKLEEELKKTA